MRVLISADYKAKNSGNFISCLLTLTSLMLDRGDLVFFVFPKVDYDLPWTEQLQQIAGTKILYASEDERKSANYLKGLINSNNIDLIHDHFSFFRHLLLHNPNDFKNVKVLIHDHMGFVNNKATFKERFKNSSVALICLIHGFGIASVLKTKDKTYLLDFRKHWYVPNGLSKERSESQSISAKDLRQIFSVKDNEKLVLILGWDMRRKGLDIAIKAMNILRKDDSSFVLGFVGGGSQPSESLQKWILENTSIDPKSEWIHYLESTEDIFAYYRAADIYLSPSRSEGYPYSILEAISQNIPCVLSDIDSQIWARGYSNAVFFKNEDYVDCANSIKRASLMKRDDSNSEQFLRKCSDIDWSHQIIDIYCYLLSK